MTWRLSFTTAASRDLRKLSPDVAGRMIAALETFAATGDGQVKKLQGMNPPRWRLRDGDYRAMLSLDHTNGVALVVRVMHRREVYR